MEALTHSASMSLARPMRKTLFSSASSRMRTLNDSSAGPTP